MKKRLYYPEMYRMYKNRIYAKSSFDDERMEESLTGILSL